MSELPQMIGAKEVATALDVSTQYAYKIIHDLNDERIQMGYAVRSGRVSKDYFIERYFGNPQKGDAEDASL
jgi:hypothetical protein